MTIGELKLVHKITQRPKQRRPGDVGFYVANKLVRERHEFALTIFFVTHRKLFGHAYSGLQPKYFYDMPPASGVYVIPVVPTGIFSDKIRKPGDIDLLVVPYEGDSLIVHRSVAIEVKALRASFLRQGRSPNELGFSQARGLQALGFPNVAVAHLIVSDESPREYWREMELAQVINRDGDVKLLGPTQTDCLPMDLIERSFGRLCKCVVDPSIGLVAAYIEVPDKTMTLRHSLWYPETRPATQNPFASMSTLQTIAKLFDRHPERFFDNPRYDPD